jgi:hypothetical protein
LFFSEEKKQKTFVFFFFTGNGHALAVHTTLPNEVAPYQNRLLVHQTPRRSPTHGYFARHAAGPVGRIPHYRKLAPGPWFNNVGTAEYVDRYQREILPPRSAPGRGRAGGRPDRHAAMLRAVFRLTA